MRLVNRKPVKPEPITEEKLVEALESAIPERWVLMILRTARAPEDFASIHEAVTHYVKFQQADDRSGHGNSRPTTQMGMIGNVNIVRRKRWKRQNENWSSSDVVQALQEADTQLRRLLVEGLKQTSEEGQKGRGGGILQRHFSMDQLKALVKGFQTQENDGGNEDAFIAKIFDGDDSDCKCKAMSRAITAMYNHC
jgi:hypothetical protein